MHTVGFPNFIGDCFMTAPYMDWNDNTDLNFLFFLKDFLENGMSYPRISNGSWNANKQINLQTAYFMLLCLEQFVEELDNFSELAVNAHGFKL